MVFTHFVLLLTGLLEQHGGYPPDRTMCVCVWEGGGILNIMTIRGISTPRGGATRGADGVMHPHLFQILVY